MKNTTKIVLGVGASIIGYSVYKTIALKNALAQVKSKISALNNIKIDWNKLTISVSVDLQLINPTNTNVGIGTAGAIVIKKIAFYNRETQSLIGEAITNISGFSINKQSTTTITDIEVTIPVLTGLLANIELFDTKKELLSTQLALSIFGKNYIINS